MCQGDDGELVQFVPGNLGRDDEGSEGDVLESEFKRGPSARKIEERWRESLQWANHTHTYPHPMHLRKKEFEKRGYTDPCLGSSKLR